MRKQLSRSLVFCICAMGLGQAHGQAASAAAAAAAFAPTAAVKPAATAATTITTAPDARWRDSFDAFDAADRQQPPAPGGVVFIGSSSIRLWTDLEHAFGDVRLVKRGFGGSRMQDCTEHLKRLVLPYAPRLVVVYAGDNDLAEGRTPEQVLASFKAFAAGVRTALPATRVAYISIKPSPLRALLLPQVRQANALIQQHVRTTPGLDYIDIFTPMLDAAGQPRAELYSADALHMNGQGYALWKAAIVQRLGADLAPQR